MNELTLTPPDERVVRRRTRRDPLPRFKHDRAHQLDAVHGCPNEQVPADHLARRVLAIVGELDVSTVEGRYSSLGRRGFAPRSLLALWVYASLIGIHHASKLAKALETDAACRLLSGGHRISRSKLSEFRQQGEALLLGAIEQTVKLAVDQELVRLDELAVDSVRLRAHASTNAVRTEKRSKARLAELDAVATEELSTEARKRHEKKVAKHKNALEECKKLGRTSVVTTNPSAALMKFPSGASGPGHRLTVTAAGVRERLIVALLIDADTHDYGKLGPMLGKTRLALTNAGVSPQAQLQLAADAGYCSTEDLLAAEAARSNNIDVLIDGVTPKNDGAQPKTFFGHERFTRLDDGGMQCPAGTRMLGPHQNSDGRIAFRGVGCESCQLRTQCTKGTNRALTIDENLERARLDMQARMREAGARKRYGKRIATVEPVFSKLEDGMGFRRASSRDASAARAEILLKVLAYNISRLIAARRLRVVYLCLGEFLETL